MIKVEDFYNQLNELGIDFFTGVPDSLLKDICGYITDVTPKENNIISANEGGSIGLAMGYAMATSKIPLVYMQNSGFGNTINPLLSLADPKVYGIPILLMIGWRGEPNVKDEPQHIKQGEVSESLLKVLNIPYTIISSDTNNLKKVFNDAIGKMKQDNTPYALLVRKGTFESYKLKKEKISSFEFNREEAIKKVVDLIENDDVIVSTTGKTSRELFEYREAKKDVHSKDFLTVGGMGHANQIALGIAISKPHKTVYCFDGDGATLMHLGSLGIIGDIAPTNFKHIIFNNGAHDSVGGQPTIGFEINFEQIFQGLNYGKVFKIENKSDFNDTFKAFKESKGPCLLEIKVNKGARRDLGRPTIAPIDNKKDFMNFLKD